MEVQTWEEEGWREFPQSSPTEGCRCRRRRSSSSRRRARIVVYVAAVDDNIDDNVADLDVRGTCE